MAANWNEAFNRLNELMEYRQDGKEQLPYYISGPRFLKIIQPVDYSLPRNYSKFMEELKTNGQKTTRSIWNAAILDSLPEDKRKEAYRLLIEELEANGAPGIPALRQAAGLNGIDDIVTPVQKPIDPQMGRVAYRNALHIINQTLKSLEQKPNLYRLMDEETIRDYTIGMLENRFKDITATRESLNKGGKTDILLKHTDQSNLFVAECKFWTGSAGLLATIDQLIGYLSWRDSKVAVVMFVKNANFSGALASLKAAVQKHPNFIRHLGDTDASSFSYIFHFPDDIQKHFELEVMAYHLP